MTPHQKAAAHITAKSLLTQAKAHLSGALDAVADVPGWGDIWDVINELYDLTGSAISRLMELPIPNTASRDNAQNPRAEQLPETEDAGPGAESHTSTAPGPLQVILDELDGYPGNAPLASYAEAVCKAIAIDRGWEFNNRPPLDQWEYACFWANAVKSTLTFATGFDWENIRREVLAIITKLEAETAEVFCGPLSPREFQEIADARKDLL